MEDTDGDGISDYDEVCNDSKCMYNPYPNGKDLDVLIPTKMVTI